MNIQAKSVRIGDRILNYDEIVLKHGSKCLDRKIAKENLQIFCSIIEQSKLKYGLFFGTLLGATRENNFIEHDEDTDIYMLYEDRESFLKLLFDFEKKGLKVVRLEENLISLMREEEYIDIYFYKIKYKYGIKKIRIYSNTTEYSAKDLENPVKKEFLGIEVYVPSNSIKLLKEMYGKNWRIPIKNRYAPPNTLFKKIGQLTYGLEKFPFYNRLKKFTRTIFEYLGL